MADDDERNALTGRARSLANLRPYPKGVSGNPEGGRRHRHRQGVADYIAAHTRNLAAVADFHLNVLKGDEKNTVLDGEGNERELPATVRERQVSAAWLAQYAIGRPFAQKQPEPSDEPEGDGKQMTAEELAKAMGMTPEEKQ